MVAWLTTVEGCDTVVEGGRLVDHRGGVIQWWTGGRLVDHRGGVIQWWRGGRPVE